MTLPSSLDRLIPWTDFSDMPEWGVCREDELE